jgi:aspartyl-tRNA(Asn)/glutamyl-tRNA(Gln) amidotransferase subunit B
VGVRRAEGLQIEPIIGLEIHVQLSTRTKMFCACEVEPGAAPNTRVCPICLGLPGALPTINRLAVEYTVRTGIALQCAIATRTQWDRKSYYYPDLPKSYQISQFDQPLCTGGHFELPRGDVIRKIRIRRAHLEEDAGKNVHDIPGATGVDLNRAGTALLEIVTEPDLRTAEEARDFAIELQRLVHYLGVSEANMQMGQMRFEPNINVRIRRDGVEYITPIVEVKNLNSFRSLQRAIEFEVDRQVQAWLDDGVTMVAGNKLNRGWDDVRELTFPQREKEEAHDYRYFADPDLAPIELDVSWIDHVREEMPELPLTRSERFVAEYKVSPRDAPALVNDRATADLLDHAAEAGGDKLILGKHFLSFWSALANERGVPIAQLGVLPGAMRDLSLLQREGLINPTAAAQIAHVLVTRAQDGGSCEPRAIAEELGLLQSRDEGQIAAWVEQVWTANADAVRDALQNPKKRQAARGFLLGQVMKLSGGKADPKLAGEAIGKRLDAMSPQL